MLALSEAADEILRTGDVGEIRVLVALGRRLVIVGQMALTLDEPEHRRPEVRYCPDEMAHR